jgi:hypothetical protein
VLVQPEYFVSRSIEELFGPLIGDGANPMPSAWADYLLSRYSFLTAQAAGSAP